MGYVDVNQKLKDISEVLGTISQNSSEEAMRRAGASSFISLPKLTFHRLQKRNIKNSWTGSPTSGIPRITIFILGEFSRTPELGFSTTKISGNGRRLAEYFGYMASVRNFISHRLFSHR